MGLDLLFFRILAFLSDCFSKVSEQLKSGGIPPGRELLYASIFSKVRQGLSV